MRRLSSTALLPFFVAPVLLGQDDIIRVETRLVVLHASVADKGGKLLTDLPRSAFNAAKLALIVWVSRDGCFAGSTGTTSTTDY